MAVVFCSYAHKDESFRNRLEISLRILQRQHLIELWTDRLIVAGQSFHDVLNREINRADIILLLVSFDFIASDYCWDIEMRRALERHEAGDAVVIPILLRPCPWEDSPFGSLAALPREGRPINTFDDPDEAYLEIVTEIKRAITSRSAKPAQGAGRTLNAPSMSFVAEGRVAGDVNRFVTEALHGKLTITGALQSATVRIRANERAGSIFAGLALSPDYELHGYRVEQAPRSTRTTPFDEYVVWSEAVNRFLRRSDIMTVRNDRKIEAVEAALRRRAPICQDVLRSQYYRAAQKQIRFINEKKTCLTSDIFPAEELVLTVCKGSYYHGFLTNELVTKQLESVGDYPRPLYDGTDDYPVERQTPARYVLRHLESSGMSDHIGVSSLFRTSDGRLQLWRQTDAALQSEFRLVPTASGSCDWADWARLPAQHKTLNRLVRRAMEREFCEESHPLKSVLHGVRINTHITGFFRWVRRGGKPEFVGISNADVHSAVLRPNLAEVDSPVAAKLSYPAATLEELLESVEQILACEDLSVPLWATLLCLRDYAQTDTQRLKSMLFASF
jgi:hypothetical protein